MLRSSVIFLFICSLFLINLLSVCQSGPDWEVSQGSVAIMEISSFFASAFMILGTITFLIKIKQYINIKSRVKILFVIWYFILLASFLVIFKNGGPIDAFRFNSPELHEKVGIFNLLGIIISLFFLLTLFRTFSQKNKRQEN
ncbi:MAG TPA: hypothetical protein VIO64_02795 [Pseudobacteroides sp.]|uniref:hypothetical protein n=1 Tax=Pseudobacteroides sp. TaxID=1968840 RepID=UPI002F921977